MEKKFNYQINDREVIITRPFEAAHTNVWEAFTDSRILDQWWAPKPWNCHTKSQEFKVNGRWLYYMEGPNGERHYSYFDYKSIDPQNSFSGLDGFCDENGNSTEDQPSSEWKITFSSDKEICTMKASCQYPDEETMKTFLDMGFLEGFETGLNQLEELLKR
ncbi:SRPBCC family protein [Sphingobacterium daejeonense]|uniref:SRPBCC family protein n=1 Tax=Sphingobacterium daejeonense TaxID=371142 RepID=UPI003D31820A